MRLKVKGTSLERDTFSNAIINTDSEGFESYHKQREAILSEKQRLANLEDQVSNMELSLTEIKDLLRSLIK